MDHPVDTWRKAYDGDVDVVLSTISPKQSLNIVILWYLRLLLLLSDVSRLMLLGLYMYKDLYMSDLDDTNLEDRPNIIFLFLLLNQPNDALNW